MLRLVAVVRRAYAIVLCLALVAGNVAVCAGWGATPEARMACCAEGMQCPMHRDGPDGEGPRVVTQAEADACCAASEQRSHSSSPAAAITIAADVLGAGLVLPAVTPPRVLADGWRTATPGPGPPVPRHLLLSVFLV